MAMRWARRLDRKRVRILRDVETVTGARFKSGDEGTFHWLGDEGLLVAADTPARRRGRRGWGQCVISSRWKPTDFEIVRPAPAGKVNE